MTFSDSVLDSIGGFSESTYPTKTLPRSELRHAGDCQVGQLAYMLACIAVQPLTRRTPLGSSATAEPPCSFPILGSAAASVRRRQTIIDVRSKIPVNFDDINQTEFSVASFTWIIWSPSLIRPSSAATLVGSTCTRGKQNVIIGALLLQQHSRLNR